MRKIIVSEFLTLDGVYEAPGGEQSLGDKGGWTFKYGSPEQMQFKMEELFNGGALLLGRKTYEGFAAAWPTITDESGFADRMNSLPKYIASTTLTTAEWNNSIILKGNLADEISKLKDEAGHDILVFGSGELVRVLMELNLVDEYRLMVFPVVLGTGNQLFTPGVSAELTRVTTTPFASGVVVLTYSR
jgi:dihydrofolate reductase